jgi:GNAT superfamily N-acetyltransferase
LWLTTVRDEASRFVRPFVEGGATQIVLRAAIVADAPALHALIAAHLEEGRLLPRTLDELAVHAPRFVVAVEPERQIVGCAELAPLSQAVAEVRSLVVSRDARRLGLGVRMVEELAARARREGYARCARSRTIRRSSSAAASRSCRTPGCRRRSRTTASRARCSATAASMRSCSSSIASSATSTPSRRAANVQ